MRYAIIQDGTVVNVIESLEAPANAIPSDTANIGDAWDGAAFIAPPAPPLESRTGDTPQKLERTLLVSRIKVTTSTGKVFDGDETSQNRMNRAITVLRETGQPSAPWTLADNTEADVTLAEFIEALALAGAAQSALWVL
jgi:hypothetical protein